MNQLDGMLYVNKDLKIVEDIKDAVGVVGYFRENGFTGEHLLENLYAYKELVNIAFFEPIAKDKNFNESFNVVREWQKEHYPNHYATLISEWFYECSYNAGVDWFGPCWTRSRWDEGYPQYRSHSLAVGTNTTDEDEKLPNVYVSLVMSKERFLKLNPDANI